MTLSKTACGVAAAAYDMKPDELLKRVELAILANGGFAHHKEWCECDASVGATPCMYCAIHDALKQTFLFLDKHKATFRELYERVAE